MSSACTRLFVLQFILQIREPRSKVPDIVNGDAVPLLNESNMYTIDRLQTLWPGVSYYYKNFNYCDIDYSINNS